MKSNAVYLILWCALSCGFDFIETATFNQQGLLGETLRYRRQLQLDSSEETGVNPYDEVSYSDKEKECLAESKFLMNGVCHTLLSRGPCEKNEQLVLVKPDDTNSGGPLRPVCRAKACTGTNEVWWPSLGQCEQRSSIKANYCNGTDKTIVTNAYGDAVCSCVSDRGEMANRNKCYRYYQRGPCKSDEVVTYNPLTGYAVCTRDLCLDKNGNRKEKLYAPLEGNGKCYRLGSNDPCKIVSEQSRFVLDTTAYVPRCSAVSLQLHVIDAPLKCRVDNNNKCRETVNVQQEDISSYLMQLKSQLRNKAKRSTQ